MNETIRRGQWHTRIFTFCPGDGTKYEVKLEPIPHLTTNLHTLKPRNWFQRWRAGVKGAWK